jgi:hypothetical protein
MPEIGLGHGIVAGGRAALLCVAPGPSSQTNSRSPSRQVGQLAVNAVSCIVLCDGAGRLDGFRGE